MKHSLSTVRQMWQLLEPVHATLYYAPEAFEEAAALGYATDERWPSYFAYRAAPLGPDFGRGEITVCVEDGEVRVTGHVEDLKPGGPFNGGDSGCVGWWIDWETASGPDSSTSTLACPHFTDKPYVEFDYDPTESEYGPKDVTGVADTHLTMVFM